MARSKIVIPEKQPIFTATIPVRITDINYGNHVGNDSLLSIIHEARIQALAHYDMTELDVKGASLILAESLILYKSQSFYGDILQIDLFAQDISRVSFDLIYQISTKREESQIIIATAKTTMICFDYNTQKTLPITAALLNILS